MYSVILMAAMTTAAPETPSWGCHGHVRSVGSCYGGLWLHGAGCSGNCYGCYGSGWGSCYGCWGSAASAAEIWHGSAPQPRPLRHWPAGW